MSFAEYGYGSSHRYDGISEVFCPSCNFREGRWCGQELKSDELEPSYCKGGEHPVRV